LLNREFKLSMNLINGEQSKQKLVFVDKFKLVNALGEWAFNIKHIPGSINISKVEGGKKVLYSNDEIIYTGQSFVYGEYYWI